MPTSRFEPSTIKNKIKREEIARKLKRQKGQGKLQKRLAQAKVEGDNPAAKKVRKLRLSVSEQHFKPLLWYAETSLGKCT